MILVDMSHLLMRNLYMNIKDIYDAESGQFYDGYFAHVVVQNVLSFARDFGASKMNPLVVCTDSKPSWRHEYYDQNCKKFGEYAGQRYKGHRKKDDTLPWDKIWSTYDAILTGLEQSSDFMVMRVERAEADDVIAVLADKCKSEGKTCFIISSDKDFKQLQHEHVVIYDPIKKLILPDINVEEFLRIHTIVGDKSDNILPIKPRTKEKTALKLLGQLDDMLATSPDLRAKYHFNRTLIDFGYIPKDVGNAIREAIQQKHFNYNAMEALKFCSKFKLQKIGSRVNEFKLRDEHVKTKLNTKAKGAIEVADAAIDAFFS